VINPTVTAPERPGPCRSRRTKVAFFCGRATHRSPRMPHFSPFLAYWLRRPGARTLLDVCATVILLRKDRNTQAMCSLSGVRLAISLSHRQTRCAHGRVVVRGAVHLCALLTIGDSMYNPIPAGHQTFTVLSGPPQCRLAESAAAPVARCTQPKTVRNDGKALPRSSTKQSASRAHLPLMCGRAIQGKATKWRAARPASNITAIARWLPRHVIDLPVQPPGASICRPVFHSLALHGTGRFYRSAADSPSSSNKPSLSPVEQVFGTRATYARRFAGRRVKYRPAMDAPGG